ncbi:Protein-disulfide oxidoreductase DsbI, partial [Frankliniella fusca]
APQQPPRSGNETKRAKGLAKSSQTAPSRTPIRIESEQKLLNTLVAIPSSCLSMLVNLLFGFYLLPPVRSVVGLIRNVESNLHILPTTSSVSATYFLRY